MSLTGAFTELMNDRVGTDTNFKNLILTAPDIDSRVFKEEIAPKLIQTQAHITLYASSKDKVLQLSKRFNGASRAGDSGEYLVVLEGIETIDATHVDTSLAGHSYYAESRSVISDIFYLIKDGKSAGERFGLDEIDTQDGKYWLFKR